MRASLPARGGRAALVAFSAALREAEVGASCPTWVGQGEGLGLGLG